MRADAVRSTLPITLLGAVWLLACHAAFAQYVPGPIANSEAQRRWVQQIQAIQARDGAYAEGLIAPFSELAQSYEQSGDYALAIGALDRAAQLVRVNRGVNSLDQAP